MCCFSLWSVHTSITKWYEAHVNLFVHLLSLWQRKKPRLTSHPSSYKMSRRIWLSCIFVVLAIKKQLQFVCYVFAECYFSPLNLDITVYIVSGLIQLILSRFANCAFSNRLPYTMFVDHIQCAVLYCWRRNGETLSMHMHIAYTEQIARSTEKELFQETFAFWTMR